MYTISRGIFLTKDEAETILNYLELEELTDDDYETLTIPQKKEYDFILEFRNFLEFIATCSPTQTQT